MNLVTLAAGMAVLAGGADTASVVVVRDFQAVAQCQAVGEVRANSMMGGVLAAYSYDRALNQLKDKTIKAGGTHVQIVDSASGHTGTRMIGTAFKCPLPTEEGVAKP